jgi:hypothetical protein
VTRFELATTRPPDEQIFFAVFDIPLFFNTFAPDLTAFTNNRFSRFCPYFDKKRQ